MRGEWVDSFRRPLGGGYERIGGQPVRGGADVGAHKYTHVIPDAISFADTSAIRGR